MYSRALSLSLSLSLSLCRGDTKDWDGRAGTQPRGTVVKDNFIHEIGFFEKQSSAWFQAKTALTTISNNIMFNMPRAAINFNDGYGCAVRFTHPSCRVALLPRAHLP